jgi:hypothetical protein
MSDNRLWNLVKKSDKAELTQIRVIGWTCTGWGADMSG